MTNLYELEKTRLKLYGEMLKKDLTQKKNKQRLQKEQSIKRDSLDLEKHIENTKKFDYFRKKQLKQLGYALKEDNMMISTMRKNPLGQHTYAEQGSSFLQSMNEMDSRRLNVLRQGLMQQYNDNKDYIANKKMIQHKISQIDRIQNERHVNRIKQWQHDSVKNYQEIKRKHQQDMNLYQKHKQLVDENNNYRDNLQSFTQVKGGVLGRYNRNQYFERKTNMMANKNEVLKQIEEGERRKSLQIQQYKKSVGDLQNSMLAKILSKPARYQSAEYNNNLKTQMLQDHLKRQDQRNQIKQKIEINNIYGGVGSRRQRQNMIKIIDKGLGLNSIQLSQSKNSISSKPDPYSRHPYENPQDKDNKSKSMVRSSRIPSRDRQNSSKIQKGSKTNYSQVEISNGSDNNNNKSEVQGKQRSNYSESRENKHKAYLSFDVITGKPKYFVPE